MEEYFESDPGVECTSEELEARRSRCVTCEKFFINNGHTICSETGCNISLMVTFKFKQCPLEKW